MVAEMCVNGQKSYIFLLCFLLQHLKLLQDFHVFTVNPENFNLSPTFWEYQSFIYWIYV